MHESNPNILIFKKMNYKLFLVLFLMMFSCKNIEQKTVAKISKIPQKPNILFILVDDLGINDLSYTGSTYYETPNIDALANQSFVFTQGYAASRVCSPSRATIMTGKFTARHGITDWIGAKTDTDWRSNNRHDKLLPAKYLEALPKEDITLAEAMKANGYTTFFAGKWHLGDVGSFPEDHGFDINIGGYESGGPKGGYFSPYENPKLDEKEPGENLTLRLANETSQFIKQKNEQPFFAFLSFYAVHGPIQTTQEKWGKYRNKSEKEGIKEAGFVMEKKLPIRQTQDNPIYGGLVESMDDAVGIVLKALKEANLDKNTIVIFTSDNGGVSSGDSFSTSNLPYKGGKGYQYEGGIREPYFIYVPWFSSAKKEYNYPATGADFYPTILDFTNANLLPNQHKDGVSLKPMIQNNARLAERSLFWHYPHYGNQGGDPSSIIRKGKWKLIHYYEENNNELYDLEKDPFEQINVAADFSKITQELHTELTTWLTSVDAKYPTIDETFDAEKRKKYEENMRTKKWASLEKERLDMLQPNFSPNKNWWGSKVTND
jgi:arylsulfatase A-like enzyme